MPAHAAPEPCHLGIVERDRGGSGSGGAGPAGLACSIAATGAGLDHLVLDKGTIANSNCRFPADMTFFSNPDKLAIGGVPFTCPDKKPSRRQPVAYYRDVTDHYGLPVRTGYAVTALRRTPGGFAVTAQRRVASMNSRRSSRR